MFLSRDLDAQPLRCSWLRAALAVWNKAVEVEDTCVLGRATAMRDIRQLSQIFSRDVLGCRQLQQLLCFTREHSQQLGTAMQQLQDFALVYRMLRSIAWRHYEPPVGFPVVVFRSFKLPTQ
jgi:hypothetical protein